MIKYFFIIFLVFSFLTLNAQFQKLEEYIEKGRSFEQICKKADKIIRKNKMEDAEYREKYLRTSTNTREFLDDEKLKFERWKWYWRDRLTEDGKFPDLNRQWLLYNKVIKEAESGSRNVLNWKHEGPVRNVGGYWGMGRTTHIDFHPSQPNIFYVASPNGGLWKTTDAGISYTSIADNLPYQPVGIVIVDPKAPNTLYITLGEKEGWWQYSMGVYKTTDGGKNWQPTSLNWKLTDTKVIYALQMNPKNSNNLIAATSDGIYKTWDGGNKWSKIRNENFSDVMYKPGDTSIVYAASNDYWGESNVHKSTDGGNSFSKVTDFKLQKAFLKFAVTPADPEYVGLNMSVDGAKKFYLSKNSAQSFEYVSDMPENLILYFSPTDKNIVYCGYVVVYQSKNGGKNWFQITDWWNSGQGYPEVHADHHFVAHHPTRKDEIYFCCDGGVYRYHESTDRWDELVNGLAITQFYKLAISTTSPPVVIGGSQDNGGWIKRSNGTWGNTNGGDAMTQVIDPTNANIGYTEYWGGNAVYRTTNGFNDLTDITSNIGAELPGQWVTPFGLNPKNPKTFIIGYNDVFVSHDRGNSFKKISNNLTGHKDNDLRDVKINPVDTQFIVATRGNIMYTTKDYGKTWKTSNLITSLEITGLEFHPKDSNRMWCTRGGFGAFKVMTSKDKGNTWINITRNFVNVPVSCIIYDEPTNFLFVGTDFGVFFSDADVIDWQYYGNGLPHTAVTDLKIHSSLRKLYISTYGRGFYSIDLPNCNAPEVQITVAVANNPYEIKDTLVVCEGMKISIKARDSLSGNYRWRGPGIDTTIFNNPNLKISQYPIYTNISGPFILEYTSDSGCVRLDTLVMKVINRPAFTITNDPQELNCKVDSVLLKLNTSQKPSTFSSKWIDSQNEIHLVDSLWAKNPGFYYYTMITTEGNCQFYEVIELNRRSDPVILKNDIENNLCFGDSSGRIETQVIAGKLPYLYIWSNLNQGPVNSDLKAGTYIVTILDANQCEVSDTIIVTEPEDFQVLKTILPSNGNDGSIDLQVTGASPPYQYLWTQEPGPVVIGNTRNLFDLPPGLYDLKITDFNNCMYIEKGIEVKSLVSTFDQQNKNFTIYPNPVTDYLTVYFKNKMDGTEAGLEILDVHGRIRPMQKVSNADQHSLKFKTDHLIPGEYFIRLKLGSKVEKIKFTKL
jgi:photosystem II stability/assembly factor-like uncharacterized protein